MLNVWRVAAHNSGAGNKMAVLHTVGLFLLKQLEYFYQPLISILCTKAFPKVLTVKLGNTGKNSKVYLKRGSKQLSFGPPFIERD